MIAGEAIGNLGVAFAFGLSLLAMAYAIGPISGCHINPAVTAGLVLSKRMQLDEAIRYWIAQVLGAIVAALLLFIVIKARTGGYDLTEEGFGANGYGDHSPGGFPVGAALIVEIVLTFFLVLTVLAATDRIANAAFAGIPIGLVLVLIHLVGIPVTNTSVNPARSIGPALFVGDWALDEPVAVHRRAADRRRPRQLRARVPVHRRGAGRAGAVRRRRRGGGRRVGALRCAQGRPRRARGD